MRIKGTSESGMTLIELMIVILIVAILAAVLMPIMGSQINRARWSEARAGCGAIAVALRAYCVENGGSIGAVDIQDDLGFAPGDLAGKYFNDGNFTVIGNTVYDHATGQFNYTIQATPGAGVNGGPLQLDQDGNWSGL